MDIEGVPLHSLCLLAPPLRVMSAAVWKVMTQQDVAQYGRLEQFVTSLWERVPGLLAFRHYVKLALGLRSRLILELCRGPEAPDSKVIFAHLDRVLTLRQEATNKSRRDAKVEMAIRNFHSLALILLEEPDERELFFQEDFPKQYGPQFDKALEKLMWEFLIRLDQLLPVPDLAQTVAWLGDAPVFLEDGGKPQLLRGLLQHEQSLGHTGSPACLLATTGDAILSSLSLPPSGRPLQESHQPVSGQTTTSSTTTSTSSGRDTEATGGVRPSPTRSRLRRGRSAGGAPIAPVIGSISLQDCQPAGTGAQVAQEEEEEKENRKGRSKRCSGSPVAPVIGSMSPQDIPTAGARVVVEEKEKEKEKEKEMERQGRRRNAPTRVTLQSDDDEEEEEVELKFQGFTQIKRKSCLPMGDWKAAPAEEDVTPPSPPPVQRQDEAATVVITDAEAKPRRKRGRPRKPIAPHGVEDVAREEAKPLQKGERPRMSGALQGHELRNRGDEKKKAREGRGWSQRGDGGMTLQCEGGFTDVRAREEQNAVKAREEQNWVKAREEQNWAALLRSCQKRQLRVLLPRLHLAEATSSRDDGNIIDSTVERDGDGGGANTSQRSDAPLGTDNVINTAADATSLKEKIAVAVRACSERQLRVELRRLDVSSPAIKELLNPTPAQSSKAKRPSVSAKKKRHVTLRKRKREGGFTAPENMAQSSDETENLKKLELFSQRTKSAGLLPASPGRSEDIVPDSEDEHTYKMFLQRYYRTTHNTLVPTLAEFL